MQLILYIDFVTYSFIYFTYSNRFLAESSGFSIILCHLQIETILLLSVLDAFYFFSLPNRSDQNFQYYVK